MFPKVVLENFYLKSRHSIDDGKTKPPHGFVIPGGQRDATRVALLVNLLRMQGIEVGRATSEIKVKTARSRPGPSSSSAISRTAASPRSCSRKQDYPIRTSAPTTTAAGRWLDAARGGQGDRRQDDPRRARRAGDRGGAGRVGDGPAAPAATPSRTTARPT